MAKIWVQKKILIKNSEVNLKAPKNWQLVKGLYGRDVTLLGPEVGPKRDVIMLELAKSKHFSIQKEKESIPLYKENKLKWIKQKGASLLKFNLGQSFPQIKANHIFNEVSYVLKKNTYIEGDLFYQCKNQKFLNLSFLTLKEKNKKFKNIWKKFLENLRC